MTLVIWTVVYLISLMICVFASKGFLLALFIGIPILWQAVKHVVTYKTESSMIPAAMTIWVLSVAFLSYFAPIEVPSMFELMFAFGTSVVLGYGVFIVQKRYFEKRSIVELEVKQPFNLTQSLENMDKVIQDKKRLYKKYGWKGLFIEEIDIDHEENSVMFTLGKVVELDKKRFTERS